MTRIYFDDRSALRSSVCSCLRLPRNPRRRVWSYPSRTYSLTTQGPTLSFILAIFIQFRVLELYIVHSSPALGEKLLVSPSPRPEPTASANSAESDVRATAANALPVVQLPLDGAILLSLLSYIFPVPPILPPTIEQIMELLSVAQIYKMDVMLTHIRNNIAQQEPPFILLPRNMAFGQKHSRQRDAR